MLAFLISRFTRFSALVRARLAGWKTMILAALVTLAGLADVLGAIDLRAFLLLIGVPEGRVGGVMAAVGLSFAVLRVITTGPAFRGRA